MRISASELEALRGDVYTIRGIEAKTTYVRLEKEYNKYVNMLKTERNVLKKKQYTKRKKEIRKEQAMLYPILAREHLVRETQYEIGLSPELSTLYKRYRRYAGAKK